MVSALQHLAGVSVNVECQVPQKKCLSLRGCSELTEALLQHCRDIMVKCPEESGYLKKRKLATDVAVKPEKQTNAMELQPYHAQQRGSYRDGHKL